MRAPPDHEGTRRAVPPSNDGLSPACTILSIGDHPSRLTGAMAKRMGTRPNNGPREVLAFARERQDFDMSRGAHTFVGSGRTITVSTTGVIASAGIPTRRAC